MIEDPAVQQVIEEQITAQIFARLDVEGLVNDAASALTDAGLPPQIALLAPTAVSGIENFITDAVDRVVTSQAFADAWVAANREAHEGLVNALEGNPDGTVSLDDGKVSIKTAAFIDVVKQQLSARGLDGLAGKIPQVDASFVVYENAELARITRAASALNTAATWLPVLVLLLAAGAVLAAPNRRRGLITVASVIAVGMLLLGLSLAVMRNLGVNAAIDAGGTGVASAAVFDQLVSLLRVSLRALGVAALVVAIAAWLSGPSSAARGVRSGIDSGLAWVRGGTIGEAEDSPVRAWFVRYRRPLQVATLIIAGLVLVLWPYPTPLVVIGTAVLTLLVLALWEILGGRRAATASPTA
jgi:hypothetical protein